MAAPVGDRKYTGELLVKKIMLSRRKLLGTGACALAATAAVSERVAAQSGTALSPKKEATIRTYYGAWEKKDWELVNSLVASDFTFSSPMDNHISKSSFKRGCWDTQINFIERFDLQQVVGNGDNAFVLYVCHTRNGKTLQNVEYFRFRDEKIAAIECYFGAPANFPSAVSGGHS